MTSGPALVVDLIGSIQPHDELEGEHLAWALAWIKGTTDIYRRTKPCTPSPHLVAYFLLIDRAAQEILLCDHRLAGLWLPTGGHVEPGERPADTVRREVVEELGIKAVFDPVHGSRPFFITVTDTVGPPAGQHTDVSLWFALAGQRDQPLQADQREFETVRWWTREELSALDHSQIEPHLFRALDALQI